MLFWLFLQNNKCVFYLPIELMLVQQNMSCINNNYEHLGELLKARSSELSALLKKVQGVHEQAESLRQWMEDTKKTAASLSNHPSGKDTVKSQIEQQKVNEMHYCGLFVGGFTFHIVFTDY